MSGKKPSDIFPRSVNKWFNHLADFRDKHPAMSLKESMKEASKTYKSLPDRYEKRVSLRGKKAKEPPTTKPKKQQSRKRKKRIKNNVNI